SRTGGEYVSLSDPGATNAIVSAVNRLQRTQNASGRQVEQVDRYAIFVGLALLLLAVDALLARRRPTAPATAARPTDLRPAAQAAVIIVALALNGFGVGDKERGNRLYREGRYAEAVEAYEEALRDGDDSPVLRYNLGTALLRLGRRSEAAPHLPAALQGTQAPLRHRPSDHPGNRGL